MATIIKVNEEDYRVHSYLYPINKVIIYDLENSEIAYECSYENICTGSVPSTIFNIIINTIFGNQNNTPYPNGFDNVRHYLLKRFVCLYDELDEYTSIDEVNRELETREIRVYDTRLFAMYRNSNPMAATANEKARQLQFGFFDMFDPDIQVAINRLNRIISSRNNLFGINNYITFDGITLTDNDLHNVVYSETALSRQISSIDGDWRLTGSVNSISNSASTTTSTFTTSSTPNVIDSNIDDYFVDVAIPVREESDEQPVVRNPIRISDLNNIRDYVIHSPARSSERINYLEERETRRQTRLNNKNEVMKYYPNRELINTNSKGALDYYLPNSLFVPGVQNNQMHVLFENLVFDKEGKINYDKIVAKENVKFSNYNFKKVFLDLDTKSIIYFDNLPTEVELLETPDGVFYNSKYTEKDVANCFISTLGRKQYHNYIEGTPKKVDHKYIKNFTKDKKGKIKYGEDSATYLITEGKRYSFGIEMEVYDGYLPDYFFKEFNLIHTYDGSIKNDKGQKCGREFVTGVLKGDSGIFHLQKICNELARRTKVNKSCGLHAHLGGFDFSDDFVVYSWLLCKKIEKELQSYLPKSRRDNEYCHNLPDNKTIFGKAFPLIEQLKNCSNKSEYETIIECLYKELFKAYAQVYPGKDVNKLTNHPQGNNAGYNHSSLRYSWINFLPCMFNVRDVREFTNEDERQQYLNGDNSAGKITSYSWEIRNHNGTTNFTKVKNWLLLFMGITYYIENNKKAIINNDKITINDILKYAYPKKSTKLIEYFSKRQELFKDDAKESSEYAVQAKRGIKQQQIKQLI